MPDTGTTRRPRAVERRISSLFAQFKSVELDANGQRVDVVRTARRGELVTLGVTEAARLDALGALAPEGHTPEMIQAALAANYDACAAARRQATDNWSSY